LAAQGLASGLNERRGSLLTIAAGLLMLALVSAAMLNMRAGSALLAEAWSGIANQLVTLGRYEEALELYKEVSAYGSAPTLAYFQARIHYFRGEYPEAEELYRTAMTGERSPERSMMNLGLSLFRQGRYEEALDTYQTFIDIYDEAYPQLARRAEAAREIIVKDFIPAGTLEGDGS
jgi:pentatricopeptide repeat protein